MSFGLGWITEAVSPTGRDVQSWPVGDLLDHDLADPSNCFCSPEADVLCSARGTFTTYTHNALDGRT